MELNKTPTICHISTVGGLCFAAVPLSSLPPLPFLPPPSSLPPSLHHSPPHTHIQHPAPHHTTPPSETRNHRVLRQLGPTASKPLCMRAPQGKSGEKPSQSLQPCFFDPPTASTPTLASEPWRGKFARDTSMCIIAKIRQGFRCNREPRSQSLPWKSPSMQVWPLPALEVTGSNSRSDLQWLLHRKLDRVN